jgi:hypothetical protein
MLEIGQRKHERVASTDLQQGTVYLGGSQQHFKIQSVRDSSPFGLGLVVDGIINKGEKVRLRILHNNSLIQMHGYVAWSSPLETDPEIVGDQHFSRLGISLN